MKAIILLVALCVQARAQSNILPVESLDKAGTLQAVQKSFDEKFDVSGGTVVGRTSFTGGASISSATILNQLCFAVDGTCQTTAGAGLSSTQTFSGANTFAGSTTITSPLYGGGGANWEILLETASVSGVTSYQFSTVISTDVTYKIKWNLSSSSAWNAQIQFSGHTTDSYSYNIALWQSVTSANLCSGTNLTHCLLTGVNSCAATNSLNIGAMGEFTFTNITSGTNYSAMHGYGDFAAFTNYGRGISSCILNISNATGKPGSPIISVTAGNMEGELELWSHSRRVR